MNQPVTNVVPMNQQPDPDFIQARAFAAIRAVDLVREMMEKGLKSATKKWAGDLDETTRAYRTILRDEREGIDKINQKAAKDLFSQVVKLLAKRDEIAEAKKQDQTERKKKIATMKAAFAEIRGIATANNEQGDLFGSTGGVRGMGWASKGTLDAIYAALLALQENSTLDTYQADLLLELGKLGLEEIDLGLDAAEAIEEDTEAAEREDDEDAGEDEEFEFPD